MAEQAMMLVKVVTPLHNGAGEGLGVADRPIIRERKTLYPFVQATTLKGAFRAEAAHTHSGPGRDDWIVTVFGGETSDGSENEGALSFGDASLLAFPVRSLKGGFVWVTSPLALFRWEHRLRLMGRPSNKFQELSKKLGALKEQDAIVASDAIRIGGGQEAVVLLEEFPMRPIGGRRSEELAQYASELAGVIFHDEEKEYWLKDLFTAKLVVLHEDSFTHFVTSSTEMQANIKITEKGTTQDGSLRYTEYLPSETILYAPLTATDSLSAKQIEGRRPSGADILGRLGTSGTIQLGGDETTGKGLVTWNIVGRCT